jgi:hypothetical protein
MIGQIKLVNNDGHGLYHMDKEAGSRIFTPPVEN